LYGKNLGEGGAASFGISSQKPQQNEAIFQLKGEFVPQTH